MAGRQPPRLQWRSGEPHCLAGDEARQVCGLHRLLAAAYFSRIRLYEMGLLSLQFQVVPYFFL